MFDGQSSQSNEYFGFCFDLNFELNHFSARFNEKMNFQNVSYRAIPC